MSNASAVGSDVKFVRARSLFAELAGTFVLVFVATSHDAIARLDHAPDPLGGALAPALIVLALIYTLGPLSGAHFNPAVSLAFALRGNFPWLRLPGYWAAQFSGALLAALLVRRLWGTAERAGITQPHHGTGSALTMEIVLTAILVTVVLATAANFKVVGHNAALAVAATIIAAGLVGGGISGASMNPARSLGPALVAGYGSNQWIYVAGPLLGMVIAVVGAVVLRGRPSAYATEAARGEWH